MATNISKLVLLYMGSIFLSSLILLDVFSALNEDLYGLWASQFVYSPFALLLFISTVFGRIKVKEPSKTVQLLSQISSTVSFAAFIAPLLLSFSLGLK